MSVDNSRWMREKKEQINKFRICMAINGKKKPTTTTTIAGARCDKHYELTNLFKWKISKIGKKMCIQYSNTRKNQSESKCIRFEHSEAKNNRIQIRQTEKAKKSTVSFYLCVLVTTSGAQSVLYPFIYWR